MSLGEKIKVYRNSKNLSQENLAEKVGVSRQAVTKWESNKSKPSTENLIRVADVLDISMNDLTSDNSLSEINRRENTTFIEQTQVVYDKAKQGNIMKINNKIKYILLIIFFINFVFFLFTPMYFSVAIFMISILISIVSVNLTYLVIKLFNDQ